MGRRVPARTPAASDGVVGLVRLLASAGQPAEGLLPQLELLLSSGP
jgi:hypothetical protein